MQTGDCSVSGLSPIIDEFQNVGCELKTHFKEVAEARDQDGGCAVETLGGGVVQWLNKIRHGKGRLRLSSEKDERTSAPVS